MLPLVKLFGHLFPTKMDTLRKHEALAFMADLTCYPGKNGIRGFPKLRIAIDKEYRGEVVVIKLTGSQLPRKLVIEIDPSVVEMPLASYIAVTMSNPIAYNMEVHKRGQGGVVFRITSENSAALLSVSFGTGKDPMDLTTPYAAPRGAETYLIEADIV